MTGMVSDLLTSLLGTEALRWSLVAVMMFMLPTVVLMGMALKPYRERLAEMVPTGQHTT